MGCESLLSQVFGWVAEAIETLRFGTGRSRISLDAELEG